MDRAEFRQWAMIYAMQGLLASSDLSGDIPNFVAERAAQLADALLEANSIDEDSSDEH